MLALSHSLGMNQCLSFPTFVYQSIPNHYLREIVIVGVGRRDDFCQIHIQSLDGGATNRTHTDDLATILTPTKMFCSFICARVEQTNRGVGHRIGANLVIVLAAVTSCTGETEVIANRFATC